MSSFGVIHLQDTSPAKNLTSKSIKFSEKFPAIHLARKVSEIFPDRPAWLRSKPPPASMVEYRRAYFLFGGIFNVPILNEVLRG